MDLPSVRLSSWIFAGEDPTNAKPLQEADRLVGRPLLIMHAREDATVPLSQAEALHAAVKGSELWIVEQAGHVDGYKVLGPAFLQRIVQFFDAHLPREQGKTGQEKSHPVGPTLRLPEGVRPSSYSLQLEVQPSAEAIRGELTIELEVTEEQPILWLNAAPEVQIDKAELSSLGFVPDSAGPLVAAQQERPNRDFVGLQFPRPVAVGKKKLTLQFHSKLLQHEGVGIFHERDADNDYVFTDFEPLDARRSLPVFDEPQYKVPLQLTLDVPEGLLAVANAPQEREVALRPGFKRVIFRPTPPLPTYLWALAVGPFGVVDAGRAGQNKIPLRILTLKGREAEGRFAASVTKPIVEQLERYLGSPFPYEKLDQIAVPNQSHAMENAGLVTYGLRTLQMNATTQTAASERRFTAVCAHELAHQWTGDLVTMKYWDDLWLNESFASFLDSKIVENLRPEWGEALDRIRTNAVAMDADSLLSARRIRQPITSNDDIVNAFDPITYAKGKAVLYMLEDWLSPTVFQKGLQGYLKKHAHANATGADFLAALSSAAADAGKVTEAGLVKEVAASFLDQPGVPLVNLALQCDGTGATLRWEQKRYLGLGTQPTEGDLLKYRIPLCYEPQGQARTCVLLDGPRGDLPLGTACPRSLLSNVDGKGYYRVQYQGELLQAALDRLFPLVETKRSGPAVFPPATTAQRVSFLRGLDALVRGGLLPADKLATILPNASSDANRHVAGAAVASAQALRELVEPSLLPAYQALIERVFGRRMQTMGLRSKPADSQDQRLLRAAWMQLVLGEGPLVAERQMQAETMLKTWLQKPGAMDAETGFALADAVA
jgi:alanyl aminopeptidase